MIFTSIQGKANSYNIDLGSGISKYLYMIENLLHFNVQKLIFHFIHVHYISFLFPEEN